MNKQEEFKKEVEKDVSVRKMADFLNIHKHELTDLASEDLLGKSEPLTVQNYEETSMKYFSPKVRDWNVFNSMVRELFVIDKLYHGEKKPLCAIVQIAATTIGVQVIGKGVMEADVEKFCTVINRFAEEGLIEHFALVRGVRCLKVEKGFVLFAYCFSLIPTRFLKMIDPHFIQEGELPIVQIQNQFD